MVRLSAQELGEDAADGPDVDARAVRLVLDEQLGRAVPARHHVLSEGRLLDALLGGVDAAREPKVANLEVAVLVDEEVAGLEVAVEHLDRRGRP